ncbi:MAG: hypothetical protein K2K48_04175 [Anaeroplasmataceae bacterium]|nr:hypothetical protein [Anaeroplasmataceae bacterium]MDE6414588.1 hypothetical protein [Anaeroplasmataceae bacterium]
MQERKSNKKGLCQKQLIADGPSKSFREQSLYDYSITLHNNCQIEDERRFQNKN